MTNILAKATVEFMQPLTAANCIGEMKTSKGPICNAVIRSHKHFNSFSGDSRLTFWVDFIEPIECSYDIDVAFEKKHYSYFDQKSTTPIEIDDLIHEVSTNPHYFYFDINYSALKRTSKHLNEYETLLVTFTVRRKESEAEESIEEALASIKVPDAKEHQQERLLRLEKDINRLSKVTFSLRKELDDLKEIKLSDLQDSFKAMELRQDTFYKNMQSLIENLNNVWDRIEQLEEINTRIDAKLAEHDKFIPFIQSLQAELERSKIEIMMLQNRIAMLQGTFPFEPIIGVS